jgi:hypothetical protein
LTFGFKEALESAFTNSMLVADLLASKEVAVVGWKVKRLSVEVIPDKS